MIKNTDKDPLSIRAASALTLALLFLSPLVYTPGFGSYTALRYFFFGTLVILIGLATTWTWLKNPDIPKSLFKSWLAYGMLVYLGAFILASIFSVDKAASFFSSFQRTDGAFTMIFAAIFALNVFTLLVINGKDFILRLLGASVLGAAVLSVLIMMFTYNTEGTWFDVSLGGATVGNSSLAAAYIIWNIFFGLYLIINSSKKLAAVWILSALVMLLSPLFINWHFESSKGVIDLIGAARGAVLGIIFGAIMVACTWLAWQPGKIKKCTGAAALVLILLGIVTSSIMLFNPSSSLHRIFASTVGENRFIFWDIALKGFKERPLLGWGPYTFNVPYQLFYDPHMAVLPVPEIWVDHAHNLIFETMVTGGIILLVALIFFLASIIISVIKAKRFGNLSALEASLIIGALTGWLLQAQFVFDSIVSITMLFLVAGITYALTSQQQKAQTISWGVQKIIFGAVTIVALILFIYTIVLPFAKIRTMISTYESKLPQRTVMWQKFKNGSPMGNGFDSVIMFDKMEKAYDKNRDEIFQGGPSGRKTAADELDAVANHLNDIVQDKKYSYEFALLGAKVSYLHMFIANNPNGPGLDRSVALAKSMLEQSPTNPESYWIASKIEFAAKNNEQAKQLLEQAYKLEPKAPDTHRLILNFAKLLKDDAYYQSSLARAKQDIPSFEE